MSSRSGDGTVFVIEKQINGIEKDKTIPNGDNDHEYSFEDALDVIGFGKVQIITLLVCGIILMAVIDETMGMMIIVLASQCDLELTAKEMGFLGAVSFIGILISSHLWGYLSDTMGRRKVIVYTLFASNLFTTLSCFANNFWLFVVIRLLAGISISGPSATLYAYLGEFNSVKNRQVSISWSSIFVGVATAFIPGIAWLILPQTWSIPIYDDLDFRPWRLLLILYTLPGFIGAICLLKLPESPKFLLSQGKEKEAYEILQWIYTTNTGKAVESLSVHKLKSEVDKDYLQNLKIRKGCTEIVKSMWNQTAPLFKRPYLVKFTICCVVQFGLFLCSAGMGLWYPNIQHRLSTMAEGELTVCSIIDMNPTENQNISLLKECSDDINPKVFLDSMTLGLLYIVGYMILAVIINPVGRKIILPVALFGSGFAGVSLYFVTNPTAIVILFSGFLMLAGLCVSVVNGAVVDLIPTHLRGMAVCISLMMGRLGCIFGSNVIGFLLEINCHVTFGFFSGFIMICAVLTFFLNPN